MEMYKIISNDRLEKLAWLVKIKLEENEKEEFLNQLNKILEAFKIIDELSLENIEPTYHVMEIVNVFREDEVRPSLSQEEALSTAKKVKDGYFVAPKIF
jgi:aspartyl-tRNA(Asn)/glutamyl-tRNA(Gln) amidotransferase subunit C